MAHRDPVTPRLRKDVLARDKGCVGPRLGMHDECGSQFGPGGQIQLELDHVFNSGMGRRGPSEMWNLVTLCGWHHRIKTESSRKWREVLYEYLEGFAYDRGEHLP
jgi:hypothetical protein